MIRYANKDKETRDEKKIIPEGVDTLDVVADLHRRRDVQRVDWVAHIPVTYF